MDDHVEHATEALRAAREHRPDFYAAIGGLEAAAAAPAPGREQAWAARVGDALSELRTSLAEHLALTEGPGGLYAEISRMQPRLDRRTQGLSSDHRVLVTLLEAASVALETDPDDDTIGATRDAVTVLLGALFRHRHRGLDLVYEAYETDLGDGG